MSGLAKTHIDIIDESAYGAGISEIIPLYVFATEQDKVIDEETGEIALGTTKNLANELLIMTSQKDVIDTFGIPKFTIENGTVHQGDELNEVGLYGLYDSLGSSSLGYALRADIDLKQLKPTQEEPSSNVPNKTLWLDTLNTSFGLFRANGKIGYNGWDRIENILLPTDENIENNKPKSSYGTDGDVAVIFDNCKQKTYEKIYDNWFEIGSQEWVENYPSYAKGLPKKVVVRNSKIRLQNVEITLSGDKSSSKSSIDVAVEEINKALINANVENTMAINDGEALLIKSQTLIQMEQLTNNVLAQLGFNMDGNTVIVNSVSVVHTSHTKVPDASVKGSVWVKTTEPNNGAKYVLKEYKSSTNSWDSTTIPMYGSFLEAEANLGTQKSGMIMKYNSDSSAEAELYSYPLSNVLTFESKNVEPTLTRGDGFDLKTIVNGTIKKFHISVFSTYLDNLVQSISNLKISNLIVEKTNEGKLRFINSAGYSIGFENPIGSVLTDLGLEEGEYANWKKALIIVQSTEPKNKAQEGTLWYNDEFKVDIMINNGDEWKGYKNYYQSINPDSNVSIMVLSSTPELKENGEPLEEGDLWINSAAINYPEIYRYSENEWQLIDNTDQSSPYGVLFADARQNAGPSYENSTHKAFSEKQEDLMLSDYVDPNCPNPQAYVKGILLFNTLYSTNNVKKFTNTYKTSTKDLGETFTVGNSKQFPTPGMPENPVTERWETISGNATNGAGIFGSKSQRTMVVRALAEAINSNDDIRSSEYDFYFVICPGYPELDDELIDLNTDKKEMFLICTDTPKKLAPKANDIVAWGTNKNNASAHGEEGRILRSEYMVRQYPPMGLTSNIDGYDVAVPSSIANMKNLLNLPRGMAPAGTQYGQVTNLASVGYITEENEYAPITVKDSLGEVICSQNINPIMPQRNTGLLFWGMDTENSYTSSLSDVTSILTILRLKRELDEACLPFFFKPNIDSVRNDFDATLRTILTDYVLRNELYDFTLVTDRTVNTNERIEKGQLWAEISVDITKYIKDIYIPIRIVRTGSLSNE